MHQSWAEHIGKENPFRVSSSSAFGWFQMVKSAHNFNIVNVETERDCGNRNRKRRRGREAHVHYMLIASCEKATAKVKWIDFNVTASLASWIKKNTTKLREKKSAHTKQNTYSYAYYILIKERCWSGDQFSVFDRNKDERRMWQQGNQLNFQTNSQFKPNTTHIKDGEKNGEEFQHNSISDN